MLSGKRIKVPQWIHGSLCVVRVDVEGHGREAVDPSLDVTRTVGWFTSIYPVRLPVTGETGAALQRVQETLRGVPVRGIAYGILRYLNRAPSLQSQPPAPVSFNYLGQVDQAVRPDGEVRPAAGRRGWGSGRSRGHFRIRART